MCLGKILVLKSCRGDSIVALCFVIFGFHLFQCIFAQKTVTAGNKGKQLFKAKVTSEPSWIQESLEAHNYFRSLHGSPPLVLNKTLSEVSQYYANYLLDTNLKNERKWTKSGIYFEHNDAARDARIGENLYYSIMTTIRDPIPASYAVTLWYEEIKDYNFSSASRKMTSDPKAKIGHLTQLLWKGTTGLGTAYASRKLADNQTLVFVVANYFRQGNLLWRGGNEKKLFVENVLPSNHSTADINAAIVHQQLKSWWKHDEFTKTKSSTPQAWQTEALETHNKYRELHGAQPLRLNPDLCKVSQHWTNYLLEKGLQSFNHHYNSVYKPEVNFLARLSNFGETSSYFVMGSEEVPVKSILKQWYKQSSHYDFANNMPLDQRKSKTDNFETMIWNSTTEFCMSFSSGEVNTGQYLTFVTAIYYPSLLSYDGDRAHNIFPVKNMTQNETESVGSSKNRQQKLK